MVEIGKSREVAVKVRLPLAGGKHMLVPKYDEMNRPVTRMAAQEVSRVTRETLDGSFGPDRGRKLVVSLKSGDILTLRPLKTRQVVSAPLDEIYRWMLQRKANTEHLRKARETKARKAALRVRRQLDAAERRVRRPLPADTSRFYGQRSYNGP